MSGTKPMGPQLRNSCDACNLSKVKCNKTRPQCQRCENRKEPCVYSVSLRSISRRHTAGTSSAGSNGKRSISGGSQNGDAADASRAKRNPHMKAPAVNFPGQTMITPPLSDVGDANIYESQFDMNGDFSDVGDIAGLPDGVDIDDPMGFLAHVLTPSATAGHAHDLDDSHITDISVVHGSCMELPSPPTTAFSMITASLSQQNVSCGCQQNILSKLSELSFPRGTPFAFDKALSINKTILGLCISVLECSSFRLHGENSVVALTLVALIIHVIGTFDLLFKFRRDSRSSSSTAATTPSATASGPGSLTSTGFNTPSNSGGGSGGSGNSSIDGGSSIGSFSGGSISSVRLMLGTYQLDRADEEALQLSLIKIELTKVERLIDVIERCFHNDAAANPASPRPQTDNELLRALIGYLRKRLWFNQEEVRTEEKTG